MFCKITFYPLLTPLNTENFWFFTPFICYKLKLITNTQGIITLFLILNIIIIGNFNHLRRLFFTLPFLRLFNSKDRINWQRFKNIDDDWLVTDFEKSLYNGQPDFSHQISDSPPSQSAQAFLNRIGEKTWGQQQGTCNRQHDPINNLLRRKTASIELVLNGKQNRHALLPQQERPQDRGENNAAHGPPKPD